MGWAQLGNSSAPHIQLAAVLVWRVQHGSTSVFGFLVEMLERLVD